MPLSFVCDPSTEETRELKLLYEDERRQILSIAKQQPLFTQRLALLIASSSRQEGMDHRVGDSIDSESLLRNPDLHSIE